MTIAGVDVSSFQGAPRNWQPIAGSIAYAGVKISEYSAGARKYINPDAAADWQALGAAGHGRIGYMFGHPSAPYKASADLFLSTVRSLGLTGQDMIALDHEAGDGLSPSNAAEWAQDVMAYLESETGRTPLLYTFLAFADEGFCTGLGKYPLWIADPSSPAGKPRVPRPWTGWVIHQHVITSPIDRDVANYPDLAAMRAALGRKVPEVTIGSVKCDGHTSLAQLAAKHQTGASTVLRLTAEHGKYSAPVAQWLDAVFKGTLPATAPIPAGALLWVPVTA